jgi:hypothetical protein
LYFKVFYFLTRDLSVHSLISRSNYSC